MTYNYELIQQQAHCNWCRNLMVMSEPISEANFVDTGKKYPALYCSNCLRVEFRVKQPKSCINPDTLDEYSIESLPDDDDGDDANDNANDNAQATEAEAAPAYEKGEQHSSSASSN